MRAVPAIVVAAVAVLEGCTPSFDAAPSQLEAARILAVLADPPEAAAGAAVSLRALVATPDGAIDGAAPSWSWCTAPKGPAEDNAVSADCIGEGALVSLGAASTVMGTIPAGACARFGPDVPPQPAGTPPLRPRDPDESGGYYQPVRVALAPLPLTFGLVRITCNLAGATPEVAARFRREYLANRNPRLVELSATRDGVRVDGRSIPAGAAIEWTARWSDESAEPFLMFDPVRAELVARREALRLSWFATAGRFVADRTGREEGDIATTSSNRWIAPEAGGPAHLFVVLRDSRGGSDALALDAQVVP